MRKIFTLIIVLMTLSFANLFSQSYVTIGTGTQSTSYPVYSVWNYGWYSVIYNQSEIGEAKQITKIAFDCINGPKTENNQKIYLKHSSNTVFGDASYENPESNGYTLVYSGNITYNNGYSIIELSIPFSYNGTDNLILHYENRDGSNDYSNFNSTVSSTNNNKGNGNDDSFPTTPGLLNPYPSSRPNIRFYYESTAPNPAVNPFPIENSVKGLVDTDLKFNLDATAQTYDVYFGTSSANLIKVLENQTAINGLNTVSYEDYNNGVFLNSKTEYFWKIVAKDATQESSTGVFKFTTQVFITNFPYNQGFEEGNPNEVVFHAGSYGIDVDWDYTDKWNYSDAEYAPHTGSKSAYISPFYMQTNDAYSLTTPRYDLSNANYQISFYWKNLNPSKNDKVSNSDITYFEISTDNGQNWTELTTIYPQVPSTDYERSIINLTNYKTENVRFRWRYKVINSANSPKSVFIDDIEIKEITGGTSISLSQTNYTFPQLFLNGKTTFDVEIQNTHAVNDLVITGCNSTGAYSCNFTGTLTPGQKQTATITYQPTQAGNNQAGSIEFLIDGNFSGNNKITLSGNCLANLTSMYEYFDTTPEESLPTNWNSIHTDYLYHFAYVENGITGEYNTAPNILRLYNAQDIDEPLMAITPGLTDFDRNTLFFYAHATAPNLKLQVGVMDNPYNPESFVLVQEFLPTSPTAQYSVTFNDENTKPYVAFRHGGGQVASIRIDNVEWKTREGNLVPYPAIAIYPTHNTTNIDMMNLPRISWSQGGGGTPTGYKLSLGTSSNANEILSEHELGNNTFYQIVQNLDYNTEYFWKIVPYNKDGAAENCPVWSFTTMADPTVSTFPWSEDFTSLATHSFGTNNFEYPMGWSIENNNDQNLCWHRISNNATYTTNAHSAPNAMHMIFGMMNPLNDWLFTPPMVMETNKKYNIKFWYKVSVYDGSTSEKMKVVIGNDNTSAGMAGKQVIFQNENLNTDFDEWQEHLYEFTPQANGTYYIGFHAYSNELQYLIHLDDVSISSTPLGIDNISSKISIYPNPTSGIVKFDVEANCKVDFFDATGKLVLSENISASKNSIDLSGLNSNLFFVRITEGNNVSFTKILKQ